MKICILGIDGLEYDFVERWDLENLKQREYGKTKVPLSDLGVPSSVQVWGSFLIGKVYEESRFESSSLLKRVYRKLNLSKVVPDNLRSSVNERIVDHRSFPDLDRKTFVEDGGFEHYNVPFLDLKNPKVLEMANELKKEEISISEFKTSLEEMYKKDKENFLKNTGKNFFGYTNFFDIIQHYFYMDEDYLEEMHRDLDKFIEEFCKKLEEDTLLLILSDHGTDGQGKHSTYGFYSVNDSLGLENPHITDFYDLIMRKLNLPTRKQRAEIKKNLKDLGYID